MKTTLLLALTLLTTQLQKNNPNGTWQSDSGTQYEIQLSGTEVTVRLVPGSNPRFIKYEVDLKNDPQEINTYQGKGFFIAKVKEKECRFDTQWRMTVVSANQIFSVSPNITPDPDTCAVKGSTDTTTILKKK